ncbi:MAG: ROK family protein [Anaerolineae bacterium]|nr:ROK family protein [Anaerolineae bacterium]
MSVPLALAIDVGGTNARFALIDSAGRLHGDMVRQPVPFLPDGSADAAALLDLFAPHVAHAQAVAGGPVPIGLSMCGNIDTETGEAVLIANLRWYNVPFGHMLHERFGLPFCAATDVRQAALAEAVWGVARGVRNFAWATVGTGYGGYLFLDGKLYPGAHGFAGNFGHVAWDEINGYKCGCGQWGCFETFVAGPAIARAGQFAVDKKRSPALAEMAAGGPVSAHMVFQAVEAGDPAAVHIIDEVIRLICINLSGVVNLLDVSMIVMGGGVVQAAPWFVERISARIRPYLMTAEAKRDLHIVRESFPNSALWGAAASVFAAQGILDPTALG